MLVEFRVKNYRCFKDWQTLSMVASNDPSLPDHVIQPAPDSVSKLALLRSAVVYGPNASGKTTLLDALFTMQFLVMESDRQKPEEEIEVTPFLFDPASAKEPTELEITFIESGIRYQYGFSVDRRRIHHEYLFAAPRGRTVMLFERTGDAAMEKDTYSFGSSLKGQNKKMSEMTRPNALFLSVAASLSHPTLSTIYKWLATKAIGIQASRIPRRSLFFHPEDYHRNLQELLQIADLGIADYRVTEVASDQAQEMSTGQGDEKAIGSSKLKTFKIEMVHRGQTSPIDLPIDDESEGTQQLFTLGSLILDVLARGRVLFVDELNASMHPLLAREIVQMFHNPAVNKCNAQLLFNTHDVSLLDHTLFRRDQVWFTEKDNRGEAHLYPLSEYSPRKGEALSKGYLQGRYGAIPFLGDFSTLLATEKCA